MALAPNQVVKTMPEIVLGEHILAWRRRGSADWKSWVCTINKVEPGRIEDTRVGYLAEYNGGYSYEFLVEKEPFPVTWGELCY